MIRELARARQGKSLATAGHHVGSLKIYVSLDSAGTAPLGNTPLVVPYDVTVDPGLVLEPATVDVAASFGDSSTSGSVQVTAPGGSTLRLENPLSTAPFSVLSVDASNVLHFTLGAQPIGTYSYVVHVYANGVYQGQSYELSKDLVVNFTVAPNDAVDYVFSPSQIDFQWSLTKYGHAVLGQFYHLYPNTNTGVTVTPGHTVQFLTQPATADGNPAATHWWNYQEGMTVAYWDGSVMSVLPLGTYTARDVYTITKNGVQQTIYFPVTLEVVP